jgi:membrane protease YdiL (CAAX protease family)
MLGSLLLGGVAILGSILIFRQGLLPLIEAAFHPGLELLSVFRRVGILLTAVAGYWAFVHWHEKRAATELHLRPIQLIVGGASGAALVALPMAMLFVLGVYEPVLFRGASSALLGVSALIGIAAILEELTYRCLLFRVLERAWGTKVALVVQAGAFALQHLENVAQGGISDVVTMPDISDFVGAALGRGVRLDAQPVGGGRQSRGMELHHTARRHTAFRH